MDWTDEELHNCTHLKTWRCRRKFSNGTVHHAEQCLCCGASLRTFKHVPDMEQLPWFDDELPQRYQEASRARQLRVLEERNQAWLAKRPERQAWYREEYLQSPEWRAWYPLIMQRDGWLCRCCLRRPATQVHHLVYDHLGQERAWELVAICRECHRMIHAVEDKPESS